MDEAYALAYRNTGEKINHKQPLGRTNRVAPRRQRMAKQFDVYKCFKCGNIFELLHVGGGSPSCCDEPMKLMREGSSDGAQEKHVPVIEKTATGFKVKVGVAPHPMVTEHWIQWIEVIADGRSYHTFLHPGDAPEAEFCIKADTVIAREYCNLHGLWKA